MNDVYDMVISTSAGEFKRSSSNATTSPVRRLRSRMSKRSHFGAAQNTSLTEGWSTQRFNAHEIIRRFQPSLVGRARQQRNDNDYVKHYVRRCKVNISGPAGISFKPTAKMRNGKNRDRRLCDAVEKSWKKWKKKKNCDIKGRRNLTRLEHKIIDDLAIDGEFFIHIVTGKTKYGFAIRIIDPQRCPIDYDESNLSNGNYIRAGIEFDDNDVPVAYYFQPQYEARYGFSGYSSGTREYIRVPADEIIHGFVDDLTEGQIRGLPWVGTSLFRLRMISGYEDAALVNARATAAAQMFISPREGTREIDDENFDEYVDEIEYEPGSVHILPDGANVIAPDSKFPTGQHGEFLKGSLRGVASGLGDSYASLANDLNGASYSGLRHGAIDVRDNWKVLQGDFIDMYAEDLFEKWLRYALLSGKIVTEDGERISIMEFDRIMESMTYRGRRWQTIDPHKEESANSEAQKKFRKAPSRIIEDGDEDDALDVYSQIRTDIDNIAEILDIDRDLVVKNLFDIEEPNHGGNQDPGNIEEAGNKDAEEDGDSPGAEKEA